MKKEIEAFVNAANEQELEAAWNNLSAEEQRVFEQLMEEEPPEDALAFFAQLYQGIEFRLRIVPFDGDVTTLIQ